GAGPSAQATPIPTPTASAKPTLAPASLTVQVGVQNVEFAGILAAEDQGYLKSLALTESLLPFGPNVQPVTVVAGGSAQVGVIGGADTFLKARASGIPVGASGTMYQKAPSGPGSLAKNTIRTPKDAVGKKIRPRPGAPGPWSP